MAFFSIAQYVGDGTTTQFAVPFPYISQTHVTVSVAGVSGSFTWVNSGLVSVSPAPALGQSVVVQRTTPLDALIVTFTDASVLEAPDMNTADLQSLYTAQEGRDLIKQTLAAVTSIVASNGNVPTPQVPTNDASVLAASGGTYGWTTNPTVASLTCNNLECNTQITVGDLHCLDVMAVGGTFAGTSGAFTGAITSDSLTTVSASTHFLDIIVPDASDGAIWFDHGDAVPSPTKVRFSITSLANGQQLVIGYNNGSGIQNVLAMDNLGSGASPRAITSAPLLPITDSSIDVGSSTLRFRNLFVANSVVVGSSTTFTAVTNVQWDTVSGTLQIKTRTFTDGVWSAESAWTGISATYANV